jgi:hypothetical protein
MQTIVLPIFSPSDFCNISIRGVILYVKIPFLLSKLMVQLASHKLPGLKNKGFIFYFFPIVTIYLEIKHAILLASESHSFSSFYLSSQWWLNLRTVFLE